jgi:hypothetical protein
MLEYNDETIIQGYDVATYLGKNVDYFCFPKDLGYDGVLKFETLSIYSLPDNGISFSTDRANCPVTSIKILNEDHMTEYTGD